MKAPFVRVAGRHAGPRTLVPKAARQDPPMPLPVASRQAPPRVRPAGLIVRRPSAPEGRTDG
jgi:hypothetical protein